MRKILTILAAAFILYPSPFLRAQTRTTVTGQAYYGPDASISTGYMNISPDCEFESSDHYTVGPGNTVQVPLSSGNISVGLVPNQNCINSTTLSAYVVNVNLSSPAGATNWTEYWQVPSSGSATLDAVRVSALPALVLALPYAQILPPANCISLGGFPEYTSGGWTCAAGTGGGGLSGVSDDTNITGTTSGSTLILGWQGTLAAARLNSNVVQGVTGDTNITGSITAQNLTLGWAGTLAAGRLNPSVVQAITNDTNITGSITAQNLALGWAGTLAAGRLNSNVVQAITNDTNITGSIATQNLTLGWTGQLSLARGGTGQSTAAASFNALSPLTALGDVLYGGASGAGTRLSGNSSTTPMYLKSLGSGSAAAAPTWGQINYSDLSGAPTFPASKTIVGTNSSGVIVDATGATLSNNTTGSAASLSGSLTQCSGATPVSTGIAANGNSNCTTIGNVIFASNMSGADAGAKITAAITALGAAGGTVKANFFGAESITSTITIPPGVIVDIRDYPAIYTCSVTCFIVNETAQLLGAGSGPDQKGSVLFMANGANADAIQVVASGGTSSYAHGTRISGFLINGNSANNTSGNGVNIWQLAETASIDHIYSGANAQDGVRFNGLNAGTYTFESISVFTNGGYGIDIHGASMTPNFRMIGGDNNALGGMFIQAESGEGPIDVNVDGCKWERQTGGNDPIFTIDGTNGIVGLSVSGCVVSSNVTIANFIKYQGPTYAAPVITLRNIDTDTYVTNLYNDTAASSVVTVASVDPTNSGMIHFWESSPWSLTSLGKIALPSFSVSLPNGLSSNICLGPVGVEYFSTMRITGPTAAFSVGGLSCQTPVDGQLETVYNTTSQPMTIVNEDTSSTAKYRITTQTGANVLIGSLGVASFIYSGASSRWQMSSAFPSGSGTVTSSGSPSTQLAAFSSATNIIPATATNVTGLFGACGAAYYLAGDGTCELLGTGTRSVSGSTDTVLAGDFDNNLSLIGSGAQTETLPTATTLGLANFGFNITNAGSATATLSATSWQIYPNDGSSGASSLSIPVGSTCFISVSAGGSAWASLCHESAFTFGSNMVATRSATGISVSAAEANSASSFCYASSAGNDSNDGLGWPTAKHSVMACHDALPASGGDIYLNDPSGSIASCVATDPSGCGIWVMGSRDPNYAAVTPGLTLTAVATSSGGNTTYTGTIGPYATLGGQTLALSGFTNSVNNGTFSCSAATSTTLTCANGSAIAETHAGVAVLAGWRATKGAVNFIGVGGAASTAFAQGQQVNIAGGGTDSLHPNMWLSDVYSYSFHNLHLLYGHNPIYVGVDSTGSNTDTGTSTWDYLFDRVNAQPAQTVGYGPTVLVGTNSDWGHFTNCSFGANATEAAALATCVRASNVVTCTSSSALPTSWSGTLKVGIFGVSDTTMNGSQSATVTGSASFTFAQNGGASSATGGYASSDAGQSMVINPNGQSSAGSGITSIDHTQFNGGGARIYCGNQGCNTYMNDSYIESAYAPPAHVIGCNGIVAETQMTFKDVLVADNVTTVPGLRSDVPAPCASHIVAIDTTVDGNAVLGGAAGPSKASILPSVYGQAGTLAGQYFGQVDTSRYAFGPVATPNGVQALTMQAPASWGTQPSGGVCPVLVAGTSATAPDGTSGAGLVTPSSGTGYACFASTAETLAVGDAVIFGAFVQSADANGYASSTTMQVSCSSCSFSPSSTSKQLSAIPVIGGAGEWQFVIGIGQVYVGGSDRLTAIGYASSTHPTAYYNPTVLYIPASLGWTQNEIYRVAQHFAAMNASCTAGQVCLLHGEQLAADSAVLGSLTNTGSTHYGVMYGGGSGAAEGSTAAGSSGLPLLGQGSAAPAFGTLDIAGGGTGQTAANAAFNALAPTTTEGDLSYFASGINTRLAIGTSGYCLLSNGTDPHWAGCPSGFTNPDTTEGDLIYYTSGAAARLAVGASGTALTSNGTDPAWGYANAVTFWAVPYNGATGGSVPTTNHIILTPVYIDKPVVGVSNLAFYVQTVDNSANVYDFGLYGPGCINSASSTPLIAHATTSGIAGSTFGASAAVNAVAFTSSDLTFPIGWYCFAFTSSATTPTLKLGVTNLTTQQLPYGAGDSITGGGATLPSTITAPALGWVATGQVTTMTLR